VVNVSSQDLQKKLKTYRLNLDEYKQIQGLLGRDPNPIEWALFSALWSEHCSYKSSKVHLKNLYSQSDRVVQSFGENAGVIDLGLGERLAFKIESHNHPSYIEPYQGAATGVGGILRDIFTMGARPIALANYLCFGTARAERMPAIVDGVVRGIGGYGNCVGVPTITGQTEFHPSYDRNVLVNAMAVGIFGPGEKIFLSKAKQPGALVVYVGAKTGRDGVHGASMASESFGEDSAKKRPTIQIGDPFFEKLLIESCIEVMAADLVLAIQDMGAAGLTSSSFEMASKGGVGLRLDLDRVPLRDSTMSPEEILLSESQERMLLICDPKKLKPIQDIFERWGLDAVAIGEVKLDKTVELFWHGECLTKIDPEILVENAPQYKREYKPWSSPRRLQLRGDIYQSHALETSDDLKAEAQRSIRSQLTNLMGCSRRWIHRQYDSRVGFATVHGCEESVGILRLQSSGRHLGVVLGCRPHLMRVDARLGGFDAVAYPSLELAAKGLEPLAVTDCLNFGNPERVEVMSEFVASLEGMNDICRELKTPIISGNVSFYNETLGVNITSTPSTGIVGLGDGLRMPPKSHFANENEVIFVLQIPAAFVSRQLLDDDNFEQTSCVSENDSRVMSSRNSSDRNLKFWGQPSAAAVAGFIHGVRTCINGMDGITSTRVVGKFGLGYCLARMAVVQRIGFNLDEQFLTELRGTSRSEEFRILAGEVLSAVPSARVVSIGETCGRALNFGGLGKTDHDEIFSEDSSFDSSFERGLGYV
jgi:phosphoribosylformylglycinamidine synthase subunit PurL